MRSLIGAFLASLILSTLVAVGGCGSRDVGSSCNDDDDCVTGTCYVGRAGGYCSAPCSEEGDTSECPVDTVCKPIQGQDRRCLLVCGSETACAGEACDEDDCPEGSSCIDVSNTDLRACEPLP